jgi:hypothetical protein
MKDFWYSLIIIILIIFLFIVKCSKKEPLVVNKIEYQWDTITVTKTDTLIIQKDKIIYLPDSTKIYTSTYESDFLKLNVRSHVDGFLLGQTFDYQLKLPQLTKTVFVKEEYHSIFAGININQNAIAPQITYIDKSNKNMFQVSYSTNKQLSFGYSRKLFKF